MTAWLASMAGAAGVVGKIGHGFADRFHARWIGGVTLASAAVAKPQLLVAHINYHRAAI